MQDTPVHDLIKRGLDGLSALILNNSGIYRDYTDEELADVTLIFTEVLLAKMHQYQKTLLTQKQLEELAVVMGNTLRDSIKLYTNVDMHEVYKPK